MQYICSEKPMRWPNKVTALHPLTHCIVFAHAPRCVFLLTTHCSLLTAHLSSLPIEGANLAVEEALNVLLCQSEGSTDICATEAF